MKNIIKELKRDVQCEKIDLNDMFEIITILNIKLLGYDITIEYIISNNISINGLRVCYDNKKYIINKYNMVNKKDKDELIVHLENHIKNWIEFIDRSEDDNN